MEFFLNSLFVELIVCCRRKIYRYGILKGPKITHGKRLFKMSPIHHHFEKCGWSETKIVVVFSAFTIVICGIVTALVILGL